MIDPLIVALREIKPDLTSDQIADILWLALQRQQIVGVLSDLKPVEPPKLVEPPKPVEPSKPVEPQKQETTVLVYPTAAPRDKDDRPIQVVDVPSLREPLTLTRALKPLMRRVPFGQPVLLDEAATVRRIADEQIWLPVLTPALEPWLEVALVIDESPSMRMLWKRTIGDVKKLLEHYGAFRDVQTWGLVTVSKPINANSQQSGTDDRNELDANNQQPNTNTQKTENPHQLKQVKIRRELWTTVDEQHCREPQELIDPSGRRLILVMSDCVSSIWQQGSVLHAINHWAKNGLVAILQVLPTWLWSRTSLEDAISVEFCSPEPGIANQYLQTKAISFWDEEEINNQEKTKKSKIKVPVLSLDPKSALNWSQMLVGKGSIWSGGVAFEKPQGPRFSESDPSASLSEEEKPAEEGPLSPEERVQQFRMSSSPTARRLAGFLAATPVINLPVVRLLQDAMLRESRQAHVAEVFLGGLLKAFLPDPITETTNPEEVLYDFEPGVREVVLNTLPTVYQIDVLEEISKY